MNIETTIEVLEVIKETHEWDPAIITKGDVIALNYAIKAVKAVKLLDDLLVIKTDGIYRPIKNTTKEECYKAIYEMSKIMRGDENGEIK